MPQGCRRHLCQHSWIPLPTGVGGISASIPGSLCPKGVGGISTSIPRSLCPEGVGGISTSIPGSLCPAGVGGISASRALPRRMPPLQVAAGWAGCSSGHKQSHVHTSAFQEPDRQGGKESELQRHHSGKIKEQAEVSPSQQNKGTGCVWKHGVSVCKHSYLRLHSTSNLGDIKCCACGTASAVLSPWGQSVPCSSQ